MLKYSDNASQLLMLESETTIPTKKLKIVSLLTFSLNCSTYSTAVSFVNLPWNLPSPCSFSASSTTCNASLAISLTSGRDAVSTTCFKPGSKIGMYFSISRLLLTNLVKFSVILTVCLNCSWEEDDIFKDLSIIGASKESAGSVTSATKVTEAKVLIQFGTFDGFANVSTMMSYLGDKSKLSKTLTNCFNTFIPSFASSGLKSVAISVKIGTAL